MHKKLFLKSISFFSFIGIVLPSCTAYNYYEDVISSHESSEEPAEDDLSETEYIPTEKEKALKDKYRLRRYNSVLFNPNFENGIKVVKRRSSILSPFFSSSSPMYEYDSVNDLYNPLPMSSDLTSNEHMSYDENGYFLFNKEYEDEMDKHYDSSYKYPDYDTNPAYYKYGNEYNKIEPADGFAHYYEFNSSIPNKGNGKALCSDDYLINDTWYISEWWRPDEGSLLLNGTYTKTGDDHTYKSVSRELTINPTNGTFRAVLDSGMEYGLRNDEAVDKNNHILKSSDSPDKWAHFLVEQVFEDTIFNVSKAKEIYIDLDFKLNSCNYTGLIEGDKDYHRAAQIYLYLSVADLRAVDKNEGIKAIWIGMPLFDSRYNVIPRNLNVDEGFEGATDRIIYKAGNQEYFEGIDEDNGIVQGKEYHVHYDILPLIKNAFEYAESIDSSSKASFAGRSYDDLVLYYMNYGYELPGAFKLDAEIKNLDIYYNPKETNIVK